MSTNHLTTNNHGLFTTPAMVTTDGDATQRLRKQLQEWCGVHIGPEKSYLFANRLRPLMRDLGVSDFDGLLSIATGDRPAFASQRSAQVRDQIIDALTTHETLFFRDRSPFDALDSHVIPQVLRSAGHQPPRLRIWSAACSTGQEPYSIAMRLHESIPDIDSWHISIIATDVSSGTISIAKEGRYQDHEVRRGTTPGQCERFFVKDGTDWIIHDRIRRMVQFSVGDLTSPAVPNGPFDIIFCRNVLIYFTPEVAQQVLRRVAGRLTKTGKLFLGSSEIPKDCDDVLQTERLATATCFRRI